MKINILLPACVLILLGGCQAQSPVLPKSQQLSTDKVSQIAATIAQKYPNLSDELRSKLLSTVVQSLDNMIFVEGGEFEMGDFGWPIDDDPADLCEWPCGVDPDRMGNITMFGDDKFVHPVKLSSYYLSKFQVKLEEFDLYFTIHGKTLFDIEYRQREDLQYRYQPTLPAPTKSWQEAKDYCGWLGQLSGYPVDLPTEAQWEYAARSRGKYVAFPTDNGSLNYGRNFPLRNNKRAFPVDKFPPSPLGFYSLSGNATDWVSDWYESDYYRHSPVEDPKGPTAGTERIRRGSYVLEDPVLSATTVRRWGVKPENEDYYSGVSFRCAIQYTKPL